MPKMETNQMFINYLLIYSCRILEARTPRYPLTSEELAEETDWLFRKKCVPQKNIAFLKIHKCASSTVQVRNLTIFLVLIFVNVYCVLYILSEHSYLL